MAISQQNPASTSQVPSLLSALASSTESLRASPYRPQAYLARARIYAGLAYPDLALSDAYRALILTDEILDEEGGEYHDQAKEGFLGEGEDQNGEGGEVDGGEADRSVLSGEKVGQMRLDDAHGGEEVDVEEEERADGFGRDLGAKVEQVAAEAYLLLVRGLVDVGCVRTAWGFCERGKARFGGEKLTENQESTGGSPIAACAKELQELQEGIIAEHKPRKANSSDDTQTAGEDDTFDPRTDLPDEGYARREIYPWNTFEPDRNDPAFLASLNEQLATVAPLLEARITELPILSSSASPARDTNSSSNRNSKGPNDDTAPTTVEKAREEGEEGTSRQLGLFARTTIPPGTQVLHERSLLTGSQRTEGVCDACSGPMPTSTSTSTSTSAASSSPDNDDNNSSSSSTAACCPECAETAFCSPACRDDAMALYHPAVCDTGAADVGKDAPPPEMADALYFLLLSRALAMARTQDCHPLGLPQTRFLWGEWEDQNGGGGGGGGGGQEEEGEEEEKGEAGEGEGPANEQQPQTSSKKKKNKPAGTLPYSFKYHVLEPIHVLELMGADIFADGEWFDGWVLNTLMAKFRGVASGRVDPRTGRPEGCAVHPLWCLANHSCAPNVWWEWGGDITFWARGEGAGTGKKVDGGRGGVVRWGPRKDEDGGLWAGGLKEGEEVLNHYCDIDLDVKERREWAKGALGGFCMCDRCRWEAGETKTR